MCGPQPSGRRLFTLHERAGMPGPHRRNTPKEERPPRALLFNNRYAMLLAQNCLDVGGLTGCNLILICLYGFGVGGLTLIGGSCAALPAAITAATLASA